MTDQNPFSEFTVGFEKSNPEKTTNEVREILGQFLGKTPVLSTFEQKLSFVLMGFSFVAAVLLSLSKLPKKAENGRTIAYVAGLFGGVGILLTALKDEIVKAFG